MIRIFLLLTTEALISIRVSDKSNFLSKRTLLDMGSQHAAHVGEMSRADYERYLSVKATLCM
jgi:hypothetical protein